MISFELIKLKVLLIPMNSALMGFLLNA